MYVPIKWLVDFSLVAINLSMMSPKRALDSILIEIKERYSFWDVAFDRFELLILCLSSQNYRNR